jgi:hypothetical protein
MADRKAKLDERRAFVKKHWDVPCDEDGAEQIALKLAGAHPLVDPQTMRRAIAHYLANYAFNSAYTFDQAEAMLRDVFKIAVLTTKWAYENEPEQTH